MRSQFLFASLILCLHHLVLCTLPNPHFEHIVLYKSLSGPSEVCPICLEEFKSGKSWLYALHAQESTNSKRHLIHISCFTANALGFSSECPVCKEPAEKMGKYNLDFLVGLFDLELLVLWHKHVSRIEFGNVKELLTEMAEAIVQANPLQRQILDSVPSLSVETKKVFKGIARFLFDGDESVIPVELQSILQRDVMHLFELVKFTPESNFHPKEEAHFEWLYFLLEEMAKCSAFVDSEEYWLNYALVVLGWKGVGPMFDVILEYKLLHVLEDPMFCTALHDLNHWTTLERALEEQPSTAKQLKRVVFFVFTSSQNLLLMQKYASQLEHFDEFEFHYVFKLFSADEYIEKCKLLLQNCKFPTVQLKLLQKMCKYFKLYPQRLAECLDLIPNDIAIMRPLLADYKSKRLWNLVQLTLHFVDDSFLKVAALVWLLQQNQLPSGWTELLQLPQEADLLGVLALEASKREKEQITDALFNLLPKEHFYWAKMFSLFRMEKVLHKLATSTTGKETLEAHFFCFLCRNLVLVPIALGKIREFPAKYLKILLVLSERRGMPATTAFLRSKLNKIPKNTNFNLEYLKASIQKSINSENVQEATDKIQQIQDSYLEIALFAHFCRAKKQEIVCLLSEAFQAETKDLIGAALEAAITAENDEAIEFILEEVDSTNPALGKCIFLVDELKEVEFERLNHLVSQSKELMAPFLFEGAIDLVEALGASGKVLNATRLYASLSLLPLSYLRLLMVRVEVLQNKQLILQLRTILKDEMNNL